MLSHRGGRSWFVALLCMEPDTGHSRLGPAIYSRFGLDIGPNAVGRRKTCRLLDASIEACLIQRFLDWHRQNS